MKTNRTIVYISDITKSMFFRQSNHKINSLISIGLLILIRIFSIYIFYLCEITLKMNIFSNISSKYFMSL